MRCAVLTVSDTRTEANDTGGRAIVTLLTEHGHEVIDKQIQKMQDAGIWARPSDTTPRE